MAESKGLGIGDWIAPAAGVVGMGLNLLTQGSQDRRQLKQQKELNKQQVESQKEMADYNYNNQLRMWEATGYGAQKKQMMDAGINPALMYGGAGSGGSTSVSSGTGVVGDKRQTVPQHREHQQRKEWE